MQAMCEFQFNYLLDDGTIVWSSAVVRMRECSGAMDEVPEVRDMQFRGSKCGNVCHECTSTKQRPIYHRADIHDGKATVCPYGANVGAKGAGRSKLPAVPKSHPRAKKAARGADVPKRKNAKKSKGVKPAAKKAACDKDGAKKTPPKTKDKEKKMQAKPDFPSAASGLRMSEFGDTWKNAHKSADAVEAVDAVVDVDADDVDADDVDADDAAQDANTPRTDDTDTTDVDDADDAPDAHDGHDANDDHDVDVDEGDDDSENVNVDDAHDGAHDDADADYADDDNDNDADVDADLEDGDDDSENGYDNDVDTGMEDNDIDSNDGEDNKLRPVERIVGNVWDLDEEPPICLYKLRWKGHNAKGDTLHLAETCPPDMLAAYKTTRQFESLPAFRRRQSGGPNKGGKRKRGRPPMSSNPSTEHEPTDAQTEYEAAIIATRARNAEIMATLITMPIKMDTTPKQKRRYKKRKPVPLTATSMNLRNSKPDNPGGSSSQ
jgi:hypothetical protein